jgi:hypothetical protein
MNKPWCWSNVAALATCLAIFSGCAPAARVVEGKVTLDGKTLASGAIEFEPVDGHHGKILGGDIKDGNYRIQIPGDGTAGKSIVRITSMQSTGRKRPAGPPAPRGTMLDEIADVVPAQFNTNSALQVDLSQTGPSNFELSSSQSK